MFNWFKKEHKNLPEFWKSYEAHFQKSAPASIEDTRFVVLDTETTGFDYKKDRILSIGAVSTTGNVININDCFEVYLDQQTFNPETVKIHGIIRDERTETISEEEAMRAFLKYIEDAVLVAHHASFDINMLNRALNRMNLPKLRNKILDTGNLYRGTKLSSNFVNREINYSLDEIAETYNIDIRDRHTAPGDAFITAIAFLKILGKLNIEGKQGVKKLFKY